LGETARLRTPILGPYTSIGDNTKITRSSIEYSIILENAVIEGVDRLEESLIGANAKLIKGVKQI